MKQAIFIFIALITLTLSSCGLMNRLPEGESFKYEVGEIVYYRVDHMPMLIEKQMVKKKRKLYQVVFKNKEGQLLYNEVAEDDLLATPPVNRARI